MSSSNCKLLYIKTQRSFCKQYWTLKDKANLSPNNRNIVVLKGNFQLLENSSVLVQGGIPKFVIWFFVVKSLKLQSRQSKMVILDKKYNWIVRLLHKTQLLSPSMSSKSRRVKFWSLRKNLTIALVQLTPWKMWGS